MAARPIIRRPNKPYPRDVTSPAPYVNGVLLKSHRTDGRSADEPCEPPAPKEMCSTKAPG